MTEVLGKKCKGWAKTDHYCVKLAVFVIKCDISDILQGMLRLSTIQMFILQGK